ncbi:3-ketoacyl-CoA synthase 11 [Hordeum vulgare]|nr:3-ketoacyl-CoA synthase 11 [Hordeum vulgare]
MSSQNKSQCTNPDIEMSAPDMDDSAIPDVEMGSDQQVERTTEEGDMSNTDGTSSSTTATKKSKRKARDPNKLHEGIIAITVDGPGGEPVIPEDTAKRVKTRVAKGQVIPFTDGRRMMHGVVLPLGMIRVQVHERRTLDRNRNIADTGLGLLLRFKETPPKAMDQIEEGSK